MKLQRLAKNDIRIYDNVINDDDDAKYLYSVGIVIEGSPDGKSGTPTFVKSVVCYTHKCDF